MLKQSQSNYVRDCEDCTLNGLFAFKGVGGVGVGRSGPECRWWRGRRAHPAASRAQVRMEGCGGEWFGVPVPRLFLFVGALHPIRRQCTSSVRVHRHVTGAVPPCLWRLWRLSGLRGSSVLELSSAWVVFRAWGVFCLGVFRLLGLGCLLLGSLWRLMLWFLRNVARNSPTCISNVEIAPLELQRFGVLHKVRVSELRASFG